MNEIIVKTGIRLSKVEVLSLLNHFDDSSDTPLHLGLDFESYSKKLSDFALFVLSYRNDNIVGFIAYYLNESSSSVYIPQIVVHKDERHQGIGHIMVDKLIKELPPIYDDIRLEVLKTNTYACKFYERESFKIMDDHGHKWLLNRHLH